MSMNQINDMASQEGAGQLFRLAMQQVRAKFERDGSAPPAIIVIITKDERGRPLPDAVVASVSSPSADLVDLEPVAAKMARSLGGVGFIAVGEAMCVGEVDGNDDRFAEAKRLLSETGELDEHPDAKHSIVITMEHVHHKPMMAVAVVEGGVLLEYEVQAVAFYKGLGESIIPAEAYGNVGQA